MRRVRFTHLRRGECRGNLAYCRDHRREPGRSWLVLSPIRHLYLGRPAVGLHESPTAEIQGIQNGVDRSSSRIAVSGAAFPSSSTGFPRAFALWSPLGGETELTRLSAT